MPELRILLASSEVDGFARTGGLGDVAASLPRALAERGHRVAVVMPFYRSVRRAGVAVERTPHVLPVPVGGRTLACRLFRSTLPNSAVPVFLIEAPDYFDRDDPAQGKGLYQQMMPGGYKADYPDNPERFTFFSRAVLEAVPAVGFIPDVIHANDWQTGLVPVYLNEVYRQRVGYELIKTVFTIHNIAFQGAFGREVMQIAGLPGWLFNHHQLEFHGQLNFMKAAIVFADAVNTVSPTYAREIQSSGEFGCGLEGLLVQNRHKLSGILNGVDYTSWNPATDRHLPAPYDAETVFAEKPKNKTALQERLGLPVDAIRPVLGVVARLAYQKGIDLILSAAPGFLDLGCQLVFLGEGDPEYHDELTQLRALHPDRVGVHLGFDNALAHLIEAGSDLFLMPSRYEPCGLNQMYSQKYGTPPVVRATGGLADTVVNVTTEHLAAGTATGFTFSDATAHALYETVQWALVLWRERPDDFRLVVRAAMAQDWSWPRSAEKYEALYQGLAARR